MKHYTSRPVFYWLLLCCAMIVAMILVGAVTRLTESGLSMVEWRAAMDMLPPLNKAAWLDVFHKYQKTPEYIQNNSGMTLSEYKQIYFWEWLHRLLGRVIGLVYALPLVYFWVRGKIPNRLKPRFIAFLALGALQGFFGWYMVKSGLVNEPRVSHFRLALHLGTALLLLCLLWAQALSLSPRAKQLAHNYITPYLKPYQPQAWLCLGVVCITVLWGAFVAGLDAGMMYNEFPLMGGRIVPGEWLDLKPWWINFVNNHATVQFLHRILAMISFVMVFSFGLRCVRSHNYLMKNMGWFLAFFISAQLFLGISTLLSVVALPLAVLHQMGAVCVLLMLVTVITFVRYERT